MSSRTYNLLIIIAVSNGLLLLDFKILLILYLSGLFPIPVFGSVLYWVLWDSVLAWDLDSRMVIVWSDGLHQMLSHGNLIAFVLGELNTGH